LSRSTFLLVPPPGFSILSSHLFHQPTFLFHRHPVLVQQHYPGIQVNAIGEMEYPHERRPAESPGGSEEKFAGEPRGSIVGSAHLSPEEAELARLGYKQEFKREFSWISTFSFAFSISGLLATVLSPVCPDLEG
jgi:hypothetical protein